MVFCIRLYVIHLYFVLYACIGAPIQGSWQECFPTVPFSSGCCYGKLPFELGFCTATCDRCLPLRARV